jgi:hypothetical protein
MFKIGLFACGSCRSILEMKIKELTQKQLSSVRCPTCHVAAGERCVTSAGGLRFSPHPDRKILAAEAVEEKSNAQCPQGGPACRSLPEIASAHKFSRNAESGHAQGTRLRLQNVVRNLIVLLRESLSDLWAYLNHKQLKPEPRQFLRTF